MWIWGFWRGCRKSGWIRRGKKLVDLEQRSYQLRASQDVYPICWQFSKFRGWIQASC